MIRGVRSLPRTVWLVSLISLVNDAASDMIYPLVPLYLASVLMAGPKALGLIEGIAEAVSSLLKLFAGVLADRSGKVRAWRWNPLEREWERAKSARPGVVLLVAANSGGYEDALGWTGDLKVTQLTVHRPPDQNSDSHDDNGSTLIGQWLELDRHTQDVVAEAGREDTRTMLVGALGCNLAWGIIDGALYLMGGLANKGQLVRALRAARRSASREEAQSILAGLLPEPVAGLVEPRDLALIEERLRQMPEPEIPRLDRDDCRSPAHNPPARSGGETKKPRRVNLAAFDQLPGRQFGCGCSPDTCLTAPSEGSSEAAYSMSASALAASPAARRCSDRFK